MQLPDNPPSPFLPVVDVAAGGQQLNNLQVAAVSGSASLQAEWFGTTIRQPAAGAILLHGFYATGSYFLTGEHRGYDRTWAAKGSAHGLGAVELAARFSVTNVATSDLPPVCGVPQLGTILYDTTIGVN